MRKFSFRSLLTFCIGLGALMLILVVFSDRPTALNTLGAGNLSALPIVDSDELLQTLDESVPHRS